MLCSVCVCSWLHTNNDDHEKNICSQPTSNRFFFSSSSLSRTKQSVFFSVFNKTTTENSLLSGQFQAILQCERAKCFEITQSQRGYFFGNLDRKTRRWRDKCNSFIHHQSEIAWNNSNIWKYLSAVRFAFCFLLPHFVVGISKFLCKNDRSHSQHTI